MEVVLNVHVVKYGGVSMASEVSEVGHCSQAGFSDGCECARCKVQRVCRNPYFSEKIW